MSAAAADVLVIVPLPDGTCGAFTLAQVAEARNRAVGYGFAPPTVTTPSAPERLLNSKELAALTGANDTLLEAMAKDRRIPSVRIGRLLRFEPRAVLAALRAAGGAP